MHDEAARALPHIAVGRNGRNRAVHGHRGSLVVDGPPVQVANLCTLLHDELAALKPDRTSGAVKALVRTINGGALGAGEPLQVIIDGAAVQHPQHAAGDAHGAHAAVIFQHRARAQSDGGGVVISGDHRVLHNIGVANFQLTKRRASVALGVRLDKIDLVRFFIGAGITAAQARIIQNDVLQGQGGLLVEG